MAGDEEYNYETIDQPYDNEMKRSPDEDVDPSLGFGVSEGVPDGGGEGTILKEGQELNDVWLGTWMKSRNYQPKTQGFMIDGRTGYIECMRIYVGKGGIEGGSIHIPDRESANSWHVDNDGNMWVGCSVDDWEVDPTRTNTNANAVIQNDGKARFYDIVVDSGVFIGAMFLTDTDGIHAAGPAAVRVEIGGDTPGASNDMILYEDTYYSGPTLVGDKATMSFKRLNSPHQTFIVQKRLGVMEMFYTEYGPGGVDNQLMIGRDGTVTDPALTYTDRIWMYAKHRLSFDTSARLASGYSELMLYDKDAGFGTFDAGASRVLLAPMGDTNPYDPSTGLGGGAIFFQVGNTTHGWVDKDGFWLRNSRMRPYVTDVYDIGSELNRFNNIYAKQFHFTDTKYLWLDTAGTPTINVAGANFYSYNLGCFHIDVQNNILVAGNTFTPQSITYLDGGGIPQTKTFLVV